MTKKQFEFVASLINAANNGTAPQHLATIAAAYFANENPRFDEARFFAACGNPLPLPPDEISHVGSMTEKAILD